MVQASSDGLFHKICSVTVSRRQVLQYCELYLCKTDWVVVNWIEADLIAFNCKKEAGFKLTK